MNDLINKYTGSLIKMKSFYEIQFITKTKNKNQNKKQITLTRIAYNELCGLNYFKKVIIGTKVIKR